ncbi:hypothetical protein ACOME3_008955 [Neoechinorhynchus agilis]
MAESRLLESGVPEERQPIQEKNGLFSRIIRPLLAEFNGTCCYLLIGMLVWCSTSDYIATAIAFGIGLAAYLACFGHISGGHFNPATTLAVFVAGEVHFVLAAIYVVTQLIGGIVAAALVKLLWRGPCAHDGSDVADHQTREVLQDVSDGQAHELVDEVNDVIRQFQIKDVMDNSWWLQVIAEALLTMIFTFVILMTTKDRMSKTGLAPFLVGLTLTACMLAGGKISQGHLNPARSLGSAILSGQWTRHYIYWAGPVLGALISGLIYRFVFAHNHYRFNKRSRR